MQRPGSSGHSREPVRLELDRSGGKWKVRSERQQGRSPVAFGTKARTLLLPGVRYSQGGSGPRGP